MNEVAKGKILISEPFLTDPSFSRSVVLITEHDKHGTIGYVLNQPTSVLLNDIIDGLPFSKKTVASGGPVERNSLHYLHSYSTIADTTEVQPGLFWSGDFDEVCDGLIAGKWSLDQFVFFVGYSGWAPGQLSEELSQKAWLVGTLPTDKMLNSTIDSNELWKHAIRDIGGKDALLANAPIDPFLN